MTAGLMAATGRTDPLYEVANPAADPEGIITKFVQYEAFRLVRDLFVHEMVGSLPDRLTVLMWYLTNYIGHRQNQVEVPLSARQIAYLNSPMPLAHASSLVTVALFNFVAREKPSCLNILDPRTLGKAIYWWCIEKAPHARLESRLVTADQVAFLRREIQWVGEEYPFNTFMVEFFNSHTELHELSMDVPLHRAAFFHYLVLYSFTEPHVSRFLPRDTLRRTMRGLPDGASAFDKVIARLALPEGATVAAAIKLRAMGLKILSKAGYSLDRDYQPKGQSNTGESRRKEHDLSQPVEPGIALVGPIRKTSGLGQATRLSYHILTDCETTKPTALAFDLDNPAPVGFASETDIAPFRHRRAINLIHLNAESIPLAFAFEAGAIFADSYNIGYFFWELNQIPKCHRLALELLDEIWVSSDYNREIYARFTDKPVVNVGMAVEVLPTVTPLARDAIGLDASAFVFLTTFDSFSFIERKNPLGVLEAFRRAFPLGSENVQLVVKTQNRTRVSDPYQIEMWRRIDRAVAADRRIIAINETYKYHDLLGLKLACDCYVSLHRSEGWGFGMLEAMQLAKPVIATAYSGNMEFCTPETAFLVGYELQGVREAEYIFVERGSQWAAPHIEEAAQHMRAVAADLPAARAKGEAAAAFIKANFSVQAIGKRYGKRLAEVRARLS